MSRHANSGQPPTARTPFLHDGRQVHARARLIVSANWSAGTETASSSGRLANGVLASSHAMPLSVEGTTASPMMTCRSAPVVPSVTFDQHSLALAHIIDPAITRPFRTAVCCPLKLPSRALRLASTSASTSSGSMSGCAARYACRSRRQQRVDCAAPTAANDVLTFPSGDHVCVAHFRLHICGVPGRRGCFTTASPMTRTTYHVKNEPFADCGCSTGNSRRPPAIPRLGAFGGVIMACPRVRALHRSHPAAPRLPPPERRGTPWQVYRSTIRAGAYRLWCHRAPTAV